MRRTWIILITCMIVSKTSGKQSPNLNFPKGFKFGAATSSFQIEGAWNVSDKGENIWDAWAHNIPDRIADRSNPDVACNSYYKYKEDIQLLKSVGLHHYRFSISWTRILQSGLANEINPVGLQYYRDLIDECLNNDIEPVVSIYHFDHPQMLEEMGGWTNDAMVEWYADYARIVFREFGSKVKIFVTINEPLQLCKGYQAPDMMAPGKYLLDVGGYRCLYNTLRAHARAYRIYDKEFRKDQGGEIGFTNPCAGSFALPEDKNPEETTDIAFQFYCGILAHPVIKGDWPQVVKDRVALVSKEQGYSKSRLPEFTPEWIKYIKGTYDYFGLNHYTSSIYSRNPDDRPYGRWDRDSDLTFLNNITWTNASSPWLKVVPEGFSQLLIKIKDEYDNPLVYVMENGYSDHGELKDYNRLNYFYGYLKELLKAVNVHGCNVMRYTFWSLLDNFELNAGYTQPFGIISVDFNDDNRPRTPKLSADWWKDVIRARKLLDIPRSPKNTGQK